MRSSQLADMSVPEIQVKFEHAKRLLAKMRVMSTYDEDYRSLLEELVPGIPATSVICPPFHCDHGDGIRLGEHVFVNANCTFLDGDISRLVPIRWSVHAYRYTLPIIRWIISSVVRKGICLSGDDRRGLLDWRRCHSVPGRHRRRPLYHRCG